MRRRRKAGRITDAPPVGKERYTVDGPREIPEQPLAALALVRAQDNALRLNCEGVFRVYMEPLFGPRVLLYRVVRHQAGDVSTYTVNRED